MLLVLLAGAMTAYAQDTAPYPLTLNDAINVALKSNPQLQASRRMQDVADSRVIQARSGLLPQLNASETFSHTNSPLWAFGTKLNQGGIQVMDFDPQRLNDPDAIENFRTALTLSWNLFDGGQTWIGWQQAMQNRTVSELGVMQNEQQVIAQTAITYSGCLLALENQSVIRQALDTAQAHLKVVNDRFNSGLAVKSDLLRAKVRIADLEQQRLEAESQVELAFSMLSAVMGCIIENRNAAALIPSFEHEAPIQGDLDQWTAQALKMRPDLKQVQLQEEIARKQVKRAGAGHMPTVSLQGSYEIDSRDFSEAADNYTIGAAVQVNLFSGQRISAMVAEAKAMLAKVQALRRGMILSIRTDVHKSFYQARNAYQSIDVARTAVDQAQEGLRITANRYRNGLLNLVTLLDAQVALQQAQTRHYKALHDYQVARTSLILASGTIEKVLQ